MLLNKWFHEPLWKSKVKVIHWPWSKVIQIQTFSNFISLETAGLIEAKFHVETPCVGGMKVNTNGLFYMTKMVAMFIYYGKKKLLKILFSGTKRPITLKLGVRHWLHEFCQVYSNQDPGLTLTYMYFTSRSKIGPFCFCMGKCLSCRFPRNCWSMWGESWYI